MRSHNYGNIQCEHLHISALERKNSFLENDNIFSQKTYATIIRTYWATKYESRCEKRNLTSAFKLLTGANIRYQVG